MSRSDVDRAALGYSRTTYDESLSSVDRELYSDDTLGDGGMYGNDNRVNNGSNRVNNGSGNDNRVNNDSNGVTSTYDTYFSSLYIHVDRYPLINHRGHKKIDADSEISAYRQSRGEEQSYLFINGDSLVDIVNNYPPDSIVTILVPGLRDIFRVHRSRLNVSEMRMFKECISTVDPLMYDIRGYNMDMEEIQDFSVDDDTVNDHEDNIQGKTTSLDEMYQVIGDITPYDVIIFELSFIIEKMKRNESIIIDIKDVPQRIVISW